MRVSLFLIMDAVVHRTHNFEVLKKTAIRHDRDDIETRRTFTHSGSMRSFER